MRHKFVQARFGQAGSETFLSRASPELRTALAIAPQLGEWVDFDLFVEATELVDRLFGRGDMAMAWDVGRFAAEHNIGLWRSIVMRLVSPKTVIGIAASMWTHHYDSGRLVLEEDPEGGVRMKIAEFLRPHRTHCLSVGGWAERTLELGRPKTVRVREVACRARGASMCDFSLVWS